MSFVHSSDTWHQYSVLSVVSLYFGNFLMFCISWIWSCTCCQQVSSPKFSITLSIINLIVLLAGMVTKLNQLAWFCLSVFQWHLYLFKWKMESTGKTFLYQLTSNTSSTVWRSFVLASWTISHFVGSFYSSFIATQLHFFTKELDWMVSLFLT